MISKKTKQMELKLFSLLLIWLQAAASCPVGWTDAGGKFCYLVTPGKMTWNAAQVVSFECSVSFKRILKKICCC